MDRGGRRNQPWRENDCPYERATTEEEGQNGKGREVKRGPTGKFRRVKRGGNQCMDIMKRPSEEEKVEVGEQVIEKSFQINWQY